MDSSSVGAPSQEEEMEITPGGPSNQSNGVPCSKLNNPQVQAIRLQNDEVSSSGDEIIAKIRKPYTITKQRERWTEEEHQKFLEALKLHGRAWRRIEEHIGTKTAVQIRSHAQKFFTKLEREASAKGVPVCKTQDINIPPPRPKRKPSHPYPRKAGNIVPNGHCGQTPNEEGNKSTSTVSFPTNGLSVGLNLGSGTQKCAAFTPYNGKAKSPQSAGNDAGGKTMESTSAAISPSSLKLFGQTVVVPRKKTGTDGEGKSAFQEFTASKDESLLATESSDKPHVVNTNESNNDSVNLQIKVGRSGSNSTSRPSNMNPEGLSMVEGSGESNASFLSADDSGQQDSESQMDNNSSFLSKKNVCSVYPRHVLVQQVEGGATDNMPDSVKSGINITSLSNDFAAINMVNTTPSTSNCSAQIPMDFPTSALPNMLLPFPVAFNPAMNNPENFTGIPAFLGPPGPNCSIPAWHLNPPSALHHPAFAAAKLAAAAMWPGLVSTVSPLAKGDSQQQPSLSEETSAVAAVTAATVAAASAWWTLHGPIPPPFLHPGVYGPFMAAMAAEAAAAAAAAAASVSGKASSSSIPVTVCEKTKPEQKNSAEVNNKIPGNKQDMPSTSAKDEAFAEGLEDSKAGSCLNGNYTDFGQQNSPSISERNTTSCMEESGDAEVPADNKNSQEEEEEGDDNGLSSTSPDENKPDRKIATERSSSGSNTPESETDPNPNLANATPRNEEAREKELDDGIGTGSSESGDVVPKFYGPEICKFPEDLAKLGDSEHVRERIDDDDNQGHEHRGQQAHANTTVRRSKPGAHPVSEEGRIAFQALFDRDVLPQNFPLRSKPRTQASGSAAQNRCASSSGHEPEKSHVEDAQQQHESAAAAVQDRACHEEAKEGYLIMQMDNGFMKEYACAKKQKQQQHSGVTLSDCSLEYHAVACGTSSSSPLHNHEAQADHQGEVDGPTSDCKPSRRCSIHGRSGSRGFVPYMRCSVEAKKDRLHSRPTQNCQEGSREEKRICLKQPVEEG